MENQQSNENQQNAEIVPEPEFVDFSDLSTLDETIKVILVSGDRPPLSKQSRSTLNKKIRAFVASQGVTKFKSAHKSILPLFGALVERHKDLYDTTAGGVYNYSQSFMESLNNETKRIRLSASRSVRPAATVQSRMANRGRRSGNYRSSSGRGGHCLNINIT